MNKKIFSIPKRLFNILIDFFIIDIVLIFTLVLVSSDLEDKILSNFFGYEFISYFLSGIFAVNLITAFPALTFQSKVVTSENLFLMLSSITIGNVVGDYLIFHFVKFRLLENVSKFLKKSTKAMSILKTRNPILKFIFMLAGASVILSPFPDELGILLLGISKVKSLTFILFSFFLNLIGTYLFLILFI